MQHYTSTILFLIKNIILTVFLCTAFYFNGYSQFYENSTKTISPFYKSTFRNKIKPNSLIAQKIKPTKYELMHWQAYYLTSAELEARYWKSNQSVAAQIADDIFTTAVNNWIYGKKNTPVQIPKF